MNAQEAAELLDLIVARAPALRAAGIRKVNLGAAAFELGPDESPDDRPAGKDAVGADKDDDEQSLVALIGGARPGEATRERPPL